jgi:DNA-3-methyladenine glycosylase
MGMTLDQGFYAGDDVVRIGRALLGKVLCSNIDGEVARVVITETEAYAGIDDKASHAYGDKRTKRTEVMYAQGGQAYVYLCYGIHHLFNVVTNMEGVPHAVLIRAGSPLEGIPQMLARRGKKKMDKSFLAGPGSLSKALGITTTLSGTSLQGNKVWIEDHGLDVTERSIQASPRIGIDYAGEDAARPFRFVLDARTLVFFRA